MKKVIFGLIISLFLASCTASNNSKLENKQEVNKSSEKISVSSSIVPLSSITNYIGGEYVEVQNMVPAGVTPHGFDLKPQDLVSISKSDLVVYLGLEHVDGFMDKALTDKNTLIVSEGIELIEGEEHVHDEHENEEDHHEDEHHDEHNHSKDPHIWGSAENAMVIAEKITNKLSEINPEQKNYFEENLNNFKEELSTVKNDYLVGVDGKEAPEFIIFHDAYNYLFNELNISSDKKIVFRANMLVDPNSDEMKELIDEIKLHGIKNAFKEPQLNGTSLDKLSLDYGLKVGILDPLGKDTSKEGYISNYKANLESLKAFYE